MKKFISSLLALMIVMSLTITAFAADKSDVQSKIDSSIKYAFDGKFAVNGYAAKDSKILLMHRKSGADVEKFKEDYLKSVKQWLDEGKDAGDVVTLAMIIDNLDAYSQDTKNFEGYNLHEKLTSFDPNNYYNPFGLYYVTETAHRLGYDDFGKNLCNDLIKRYYKLGEGTNFWNGFGTSPDDLSAFVLAIAPYQDDYKEYITDALTIAETFGGENGYGFTADAPNADSTAMVLAANAVAGNKEKADAVYNQLLKYYDEKTGGFAGTASSYMATSNAVLAMEYYVDFLNKEENKPNEDTIVPPTVDNNDKNENKDETVNDNKNEVNTDKSDKSPNTGAVTVGAAVSAFALALATTTSVLKKKEN